MYLFDLGVLPGQSSMTIFHALARLGIESLVLVSPKTPLVSVGYFQDLGGVDLDYCQRHGISVMRRELGGGTTLLDQNQVFYQVVLKKNNPILPGNIDQLYRDFSKPVIGAYAALGVKTKFKPVNDIVTLEGRKISGEGGGDIGDCIVFVGGILMDFDFGLMSRVLKLPDEKFRDKVHKTMEENLTTLKRELGVAPDRKAVIRALSVNFEKALGKLTPAQLPGEVWSLARSLEQQFTSEAFMRKNDRRMGYSGQNRVKINAEVSLWQGVHKAPGGLIQAIVTTKGGVIDELQILGDFTFYPKDLLFQLVNNLTGVPYQLAAVRDKLEELLAKNDFEMPGVSADDLCQAIIGKARAEVQDCGSQHAN